MTEQRLGRIESMEYMKLSYDENNEPIWARVAKTQDSYVVLYEDKTICECRTQEMAQFVSDAVNEKLCDEAAIEQRSEHAVSGWGDAYPTTEEMIALTL